MGDGGAGSRWQALMPIFEVQANGKTYEVDALSLRAAIKAVKRVMRETTPAASAIVLKHAKTRTEKGQVRTVRGAKIWKDQSDGMLFQVKGGGRPRKDGLSLTRLIPDKIRAYGLQRSVYISPRWTDEARNGLVLEGSYKPSSEHRQREDRDEGEE